MIIVKDSMVLIHLAKITLLENSCDYFKKVFITEKIKEEIARGNYPDSKIIGMLITKNKIKIKSIKNNTLIRKANEFNIQGAEAEAIALYWELKADFIATDDDNVRKKRDVLNLNVIGTPVIILKLYKEKKITKVKLEEAIQKLRKIGWFSNTVWDKINMELSKK